MSRLRTNKVQPLMGQFVEKSHVLKVDIRDLFEANFDLS